MAKMRHMMEPSEKLPKHGPTWTFYAFAVLAVLVVIATYFGFVHASHPYLLR